MTVLSTTSSQRFHGSGSTGPFTFSWRFLDNDDIKVYRIAEPNEEDPTSEARVLLIEGTEYTLSGAGSYTGGSLTLISALAEGEDLLVKRRTPKLQTTDIRNQGNNFFPEVHEDAFDRLTMMLQDLETDALEPTLEAEAAASAAKGSETAASGSASAADISAQQSASSAQASGNSAAASAASAQNASDFADEAEAHAQAAIAGQANGAYGYTDKATMDADLTPDDNAVALVSNDPTPANNGWWVKDGATGTGSWVQSSYDRVAQLERSAAQPDETGRLVGVYVDDLMYNPTDAEMTGDATYSPVTAATYEAIPRAMSFDSLEIFLSASEANLPGVELRVYQSDVDPGAVATPFDPGTLLSTVELPNLTMSKAKRTVALPEAVTIAKDTWLIVMAVATISGDVGIARWTTDPDGLRGSLLYSSNRDGSGLSRGTGAYNNAPVRLRLKSDETKARESLESTLTAALETKASKDANHQIRDAAIPYNTFAPDLGDAEMDGTSDYNSSKIGGFYEEMVERTPFNTIQGRIWCEDTDSDIEWRAWIRESSASFDTTAVDPDDSGVLAAGAFPASNMLFTHRLNKVLVAESGKYVFLIFRAASDAAIKFRQWAYDDTIDPPRVGFLFNTNNGWPTSISFGAALSGRGKIASKFYLESEESRAKGYGSASDITFDASGTGLQGDSVQSAVSELAGAVPLSPAGMALPPKIWAVVGHEMSVYFDNLLAERDASDYNWDITCDVGTHQNERWTITPVAAGESAFAVKAHQKGRETASLSGSATVIAKAAEVGTGANRTCLFIGDSTTANGGSGMYLAQLNTLFGSDVMDVTMIGTQTGYGTAHEGRPGWSINTFYTGVDSPFVFSEVFDFDQYLTDNSFATPDYVFIHLGINDLLGETSDADVDSKAAVMLTQLEGMIDSIQANDPGTKIGMMVTIPPSATQDAFGANYDSGQTRWRYKRNIVRWAQTMIDQFKNREGELIYLVPVNVNLDTLHNMNAATTDANSRTTTQIVRQSNGVHPSEEGYGQMADTVFAFLKCQES